ncbi:hypothetical protein YPPY46_4815 [Yersinia pestis PY-46]|uniref:Uncharacterized protein n=2 Tax=Yersinia pestis TaxID=632 RepID=A0AAV3B8H7_YERPE|nr:hypothetical protein YPIP275_0397 [Yersinia pestis biovar Orientalis str. IP275]EDR36856.1 hypothetical protein YpF1991016_2159 [Yersinia pestis biovar Orientalis str. F1991016]EDR41202.1 hypothetical protein YpE1979001_0778 [Yersinia pestis biovar Antiqua str. E1979001]EDR48679.1 hypothetical protein YpB42003004_0377 [Yersinia pestis biovar Antiqua str. B42003004]EDR55064.1 hypothetical protein YpMG051020_1632 [Yersinia pestis biovar Orientalis str. MG05-1020]EDR59473.1 hypothetical protei
MDHYCTVRYTGVGVRIPSCVNIIWHCDVTFLFFGFACR